MGKEKKKHSCHFPETWLSYSFNLLATVVLKTSPQPGHLLANPVEVQDPDCGWPSTTDGHAHC